MTNQIRLEETDVRKAWALFERALEDDEEALRQLHELVYTPQACLNSRAVRCAASALRALGGPTLDGARPADASASADSPWVIAYVDQILADAGR